MDKDRNYLKTCFDSFTKVTEQKYGRPFDLRAIEKSVAHVSQNRTLNFEDVRLIQKSKYWTYEKHWSSLSEEDSGPGLERLNRKLDFWNLPRKEDVLIKQLFDVFRHIGIVSIILRFVAPKYFGITSPPVEKILDVRRGSSDVETYINYLENLREIGNYYGFSRIADVDMALWVLHECCFGEKADERMIKEYNNDIFIKTLRAKNLAHLLNISDPQLAKSLLDVNLKLAAQIGGICFEQMVKKTAQKSNSSFESNGSEQSLEDIINRLQACGVIDELQKGKWQSARRTRNKAIHDSGGLTRREVEILIGQIE